MDYCVLYGKARIQAADLVQLCRAINAVEPEHGFKVLVYDAETLIGTGLYWRCVPWYCKCIAPLVCCNEGDEQGAAQGLGSRITERSYAVVAFLRLQTQLSWSAQEDE